MRRQRGVSLIEMVIGLAIIGFVLSAAMPSLSNFMTNQRVRVAGETLLSGLQLARAEAVKRNGSVEVVITDDDPVAAGVNSIAPAATGRNWVVRYNNPTTLFYEFVDGQSGDVGAGALGATPVLLTAADATIIFNGLGRTNLGATSTYTLTSPAAGLCVPTGTVRCLNIVVSAAGQARMCDPDPRLNARDTRKC